MSILLCLGLVMISHFSHGQNLPRMPPPGKDVSSYSFDVGYDVPLVEKQARRLSTHSWEYGTAAEALLEFHSPEISVFGEDPFPGGRIPYVDWTDVPALTYVEPFIRTDNDTLIDGDGAVGDPASMGISAVLIGQTNRTYFDAASREESSVINDAPRFWNGAISHRYSTPELWADFVYMAPPFLAYYAVATKNDTLLRLAIEQCMLYRQILQSNISEPFTGLWEHIIGPEDFQPQLWSTGNAWAAAGMTRVLATTKKWDHSSSWAYEQGCLTQWIKEILDGAIHSRQISVDPSTGLLRNVLNETTWFGETSGTALLSSVVYRMAVLAPGLFSRESSYIEWAEKSRKATGLHVRVDGILSPAINPLDWGNHTPYTTGSPEGESFGVLLAAAYRDWVHFLSA